MRWGALGSRVVALLAALLGAAGCASSRLPDWAHGGAREIAPETADTDVIAYRTLTRDDFRGSEPPPSLAEHRDDVGAATCAYFRTGPGIEVEVRPSARAADTPRYDVSLRGLAVETVMSRSCSWWNAEQEALPQDYVLQHEQIHFALFELAARRFNADAARIAAKCAYSGEDPKALVAQTRGCLRERIDAAMREAMAENRRFDEDTSYAHEPDKQRAWFARVQRELAAGSP
jgi:hypothetical protein